ncbi:MAG: A/G-specific adenine glycosylase [Pseudolabrys sp.]|nr:A/G-specific adenine glycosylase [Pseudolabrys sp.]
MTLASPNAKKPRTNKRVHNSAQKRQPDPGVLLAWYDKHARVLPWRARKGEKSDPYRVWLSEIMLQQTTVKTVAPYFAKFLRQWPTIEALAKAKLDDVLRAWAGLGYYARARNLHACAQTVVARHGGLFPTHEDVLAGLPGIGAYTAGMIASIAFARPVVAVDGNIERVISRLFRVEQPLPAAKPEIRRLTNSISPQSRHGDFAQAMMDLGATICTPKSPACVLCPWSEPCAARKRGDQETFPRKTPKKEGALRRGAAFVALREDGYVLLRTRAEKGLLGAMSEVPGSDWSADFNLDQGRKAAPQLGALDWQRRAGAVMHVFTHFPLELTVFAASVPKKTAAPDGMRWIKLADLAGEALPNVMRKVIAHGLLNFGVEAFELPARKTKNR